MATINPVTDWTPTGDNAVLRITWGPFGEGDTIVPIQQCGWSERTVQVTGTVGTGSPALVIQGSNDGVNFNTLQNRVSTALTFSAAGIQTCQDRPIWMAPKITGGTGWAITVIVACHRFDLPGKSW